MEEDLVKEEMIPYMLKVADAKAECEIKILEALKELDRKLGEGLTLVDSISVEWVDVSTFNRPATILTGVNISLKVG